MTIARLLAHRGAVEVVTCSAPTPMRDAVALLAERRIGAMPVMDEGRVAGIFSERDVIYCLAQQGPGSLDLPVGQVMTSPPITVTRAERVDRALALMTKRRIRHLPVVEDGHLVSLVSIGDLVKYRIDEVQKEAEEMRSYIQTV